MSTVIAPPRPAGSPSPDPNPRRWTVDEFHRLWEEGWFEGRKPMLLDGEILEMAIPNPPHDVSIGLTQEQFRRALPVGYWIRVQMPLPLGLWTDPVPDLSVVTGSPRDYVARHPSSAVLVAEIAESSLRIDLNEKSELFAAGGILDYWVIDLNNRRLIVFRDPEPSAVSTVGFHYRTRIELDSAASVSPLAAPQCSIRVADLLP